MRVFCPIVFMTTCDLTGAVSNLIHSCAVRAKSIGHDFLRVAVPLHRFLQEFQRRSLVSGFGDIGFQHLALVVDCAPQVMGLAVYLHKHLIQVPAPLRDLAKLLRSTLLDLLRHHRAKPVPPKSDRLVCDIDTSLVKQVFHIPK